MKTKIYTLAAILALQVSILFGANNMNNAAPVKNTNNAISVILLPVTPSEADFSDIIPEPAVKTANLAPTTPETADFEEITPESKVSVINLSPETPVTAEFTESEESSFASLIPESPKSADFE
jgi:PBP1b-binding outer membrane lipoprotein LpoB